MNEDPIDQKIQELEALMTEPDFWADKNRAQAVIKEIQDLKTQKEGGGKYDKGGAILTIFSGAGGDDAEDFSAILFNMYRKYIESKGWSWTLIHENKNDHGGFRNITIEIDPSGSGQVGVYGTLKNESGVHRLVRISPFNAKQLRHTSFSMVEIIPKFEKQEEIDLKPDEIRVELSRAGGPGGTKCQQTRDGSARSSYSNESFCSCHFRAVASSK
jgi:peptide chain release factor 2